VGHDGNTGDAIRMTQQVGGALWHMSESFGWYAFKAAEYPAAFPVDFRGAGFLLVNAAGQRFGDETGYEVHERLRALVNVKPTLGYYPALPVFGICDGATLSAGPLNGVVGTPNDYRWSADNLTEVRKGWIRRADSPAELAGHIGVAAAELTSTLTGFNAAATAGRGETPCPGWCARTGPPCRDCMRQAGPAASRVRSRTPAGAFDEYIRRFNAEDATAFEEFLAPDMRMQNGTLVYYGVRGMKDHYAKIWGTLSERLKGKHSGPLAHV
jgi:hypothetical protein